MQRYEYKFVRLEEVKQWFFGTTTPGETAREGYQDVIRQHAADGWRLVQIFAPGLGAYGAAAFFELIFERPAAAGERVTSGPP
jgi:hypothetical protein